MPFKPVSISLLVFCAAMPCGSVYAQTGPFGAAPVASQATAPPRAISSNAPIWGKLSPTQQQTLAPLNQTWDSLSEAHRRKWIALVENYSNMTATEQSMLRSRMVEWAELKPHEREQARLNFALSKKLPPADRSANWEAYQALSPEDKKKFAAVGTPKPAGAAVAIKPASPEKLASAPVIRNAPDARKAISGGSQLVNRNTLLPTTPKNTPEALPSNPAATN